MPKYSYRKRDPLFNEVDLNKVLENGYYLFSSVTNKINFPSEFTDNFGTLEVINPGYSPTDSNASTFAVQRLWSYNNELFVRVKGGLGAQYVWSNWRKI